MNNVESKIVELLSPKWVVFIKLLPSRLRDLCGKRRILCFLRRGVKGRWLAQRRYPPAKSCDRPYAKASLFGTWWRGRVRGRGTERDRKRDEGKKGGRGPWGHVGKREKERKRKGREGEREGDGKRKVRGRGGGEKEGRKGQEESYL